MGNYNPVYKTIWTSKHFTKLNSTEKLVYLNLLTNRQSTQSGIYTILPDYIACDCKISTDEALKILKKLDELHMIKFWEEENLIFIHKYFKYTKGTIKHPYNLTKTLERERELLNFPEVWELFDMEFSQELHLINEKLIKHQSNKNKNKSRNKDNSNS